MLRVERFLAQRFRLFQPPLFGERAGEDPLNLQGCVMVWSQPLSGPRAEFLQKLYGPCRVSLHQAQHGEFLGANKPVQLVRIPDALKTCQSCLETLLRLRMGATD